MRNPFSAYVLLFLAFSSALALRLPFQKQAVTGASVSSVFKSSFSFSSLSQSQTTATQDVNNVQDARYVTNITINGVQVTVALDTGSTDLWVIPPGGIGTFNDTGIEVSLLYGDGTYGTSGTIGVAPFEFGPYKIEQQAFLNAVQSNIAGMQDIGIFGLMGLSFDFATASPINEKIESIYGPDATWGRSVLKNIFKQNPSEPNMIAILLARTGDMEDTDGGSFTIGEYLPQYASVVNQTKLPQFPKGGDRWTVLMDGIYVDGAALNLESTSNGVPSGQAQTLLDTGNSNALLPTGLYDVLYSLIPGSILYNGASGRFWVIPCNTTTNLEFVFAGVHYPVHPLDLSTITSPVTVDGQQYTACTAAFQSGDDSSSSGFDVALGDSFLRNVYSIFDFGDNAANGAISDPYIQLLSTLDPAKAISEVATIRGQTLASLPPEMDPTRLVGLVTNIEASSGAAAFFQSSSASSAIVTPTSSSGSPSLDSDGPKSKSKTDVQLAVGGAGGVGQAVFIDGSVVDKYGSVIVGLLAANLFVGLLLLIFGVLSYVKRGSSKNLGRKNTIDPPGPPVYVPVKNVDQDEGYRFSEANMKRYIS
ncbi:aspartic peptidase domain-containing protein [Gymnopilus junonius]|uniref:Aspartic peptidase domain-containing protein n=1 Tax=Gymnopilus junonius TaxID=109634 RepID=A0A9P5TLT0_GYMJU|nr:aspartic peptidase domain-containing protein [Gymnopilus junonius]